MIDSNAPVVTVITPAYNVRAFIGEALDSVMAQTFTNFEYVVVDDGSTDGTVAEIERRALTDPRIRLVRAKHGGGAQARNVGIKAAQGRYIAFLDGDDRWHAKFLERQLSSIEGLGPDVAAVFCRARVMSESGRIYMARWQRGGRYDFDEMLVQSCPPRVGSSLLIKRQAFDQAGLFDVSVKSAQDLDMWLRIQRDSEMPYFWGAGDYSVDVRVRTGAVSRDHGKRFEALDEIIRKYGPSMKRAPLGMAYVRAAVFAYRSGDDGRADVWALRARTAGWFRLARDGYGLRVLFWKSRSIHQRHAIRTVTNGVKSFARKALKPGGFRS